MSDEAFAAIPQRVRSLRLWLGLSEAELAARIGISVRSYRALEVRDRKRGWVVVFCRLAEETGVSLDWLMNGRPPGVWDQAARNDAVPFGFDGRVLPRPAMARAA